jgi:hypothetical protein
MSQLVSCPECKKHLQVPDELLGKRVQCPECKHTFTAKSADEEEEEPSKTGTTISKAPPSKRREEPEEEEERPSRRSSRRDDDDDDIDDIPRRSRRRSSRGNYVPHRGGLILAFGLIGLIGGFTGLVFPVVFGIIAWIMGNTDIAEIRAGRMDPEGEGMTQAGRIMGMIATILFIVAIVVTCGILGCFILIPLVMVGGAAAGAAGQPQPKRRF